MSGEITLDVDPESLSEWRSNPVTMKVMEFLANVRDDHRMRALDAPLMSYTAEQTALYMARLQGVVAGIDEMLSLKGELQR